MVSHKPEFGGAYINTNVKTLVEKAHTRPLLQLFAICVFGIFNQSTSSSSTLQDLEVPKENLDLPIRRCKSPLHVYRRRKYMANSSGGDVSNQDSSSESVKETGSKNKRKHLSECSSNIAVEEMHSPVTEFPEFDLSNEDFANEIFELGLSLGLPDQLIEDEMTECLMAEWDDPVACEFQELLSDTLYTTFGNAIKKIAECGHSEEVAEQLVLRSGYCYGDKDPVTNTVDGALLCFEKEQGLNSSSDHLFQNMQHLVDFTMLEMVNMLREVKPSLSIGEAMWCMFICDLNLSKACALETDVLDCLRAKELTGRSSSNPAVPQIKSEVKPCVTISLETSSSAISKPTDPRKSQSNLDSEWESLNLLSIKIPVTGCKSGSITGGHIQTVSQPTSTEDASGVARKCSSGNSKRDILRQRTLHMEKYRGRMSKGGFKSKPTSFSSFVMDKKPKSYYDPSATYMKYASSKESAAVSINQQAASGIPATTPVKDVSAVVGGNSKMIPPEAKSMAGSQIKTVCPTKTPDYYTGIPYDKSKGKYVPQNDKDEMLLALVSKKEALEKELQHWTDWTSEKVRQAAHRLGKDKAELKALKQEKEEAEKITKEMQNLEENNVKRLSEMEYALSNANEQIDMANSTVRKLELQNSVLKKEMESAKLLALMSAEKLQKTVLNEQETLKNIQACNSEKGLLLEELTSHKNKAARQFKSLENAKVLCSRSEALLKQEENDKDKVLAQASSLRKERERLEAMAKEEGDTIRGRADYELQKYNDSIKDLEQQISKLRMESESSKIAALREGIKRSYVKHPTDSKLPAKGGYLIPNVYKRLPVFQELSRSETVRKKNRECVMCMAEDISVIFLPCAHQVLCEDCNVRHEKQGITECPSCRGKIQTRFKPRFVKKQNK